MLEIFDQFLTWFVGVSSELKVTIVLGGVAGIGSAIFGVFKAIAWWFDREKANEKPPVGIPATAVDDLLSVQGKRHSKEKSKLNKKLEKLKTASVDEKKVLQAEIEELRRRDLNPEKALKDAQETITNLKSALEREGNILGSDDLEKATLALEAGDTSLAESLFQQIKDSNALNIQASARASFALGEIAEEGVNWQKAFEQYDEAARLHPCFQYLIHAQKMALHLALYDQAESHGRATLTAAEKEFGKDATEYGHALNNLAALLKATGRYAEAEPLFRQALEITRAALGEEHPDFGIRLNNLAELLRATGRYAEAEPLYRQALENARAALGEEHPEFGISLSNLAGLLKATGRYAEAEPLYRQALEIARAALGEDHPEFGMRLSNLAGLLQATGRYAEAEPLYRQALENARAALGEGHPEFGIRLNNLAELLVATGRFEEAEPLYRQAVAVLEKALGSDHPNTQTVKVNFEHFLANRPPAD